MLGRLLKVLTAHRPQQPLRVSVLAAPTLGSASWQAGPRCPALPHLQELLDASQGPWTPVRTLLRRSVTGTEFKLCPHLPPGTSVSRSVEAAQVPWLGTPPARPLLPLVHPWSGGSSSVWALVTWLSKQQGKCCPPALRRRRGVALPSQAPWCPRLGSVPDAMFSWGRLAVLPTAAAAASPSCAGGAARPVSGWRPTSRHQLWARGGVPATLPSLPRPPSQQSRVPGSLARAEPQPQQEHRQRLGDGVRRVLTRLRG